MITQGRWAPMFYSISPEDRAESEKVGVVVPKWRTNEGQIVLMATDSDGERKRVALVECQTRFKRGTGYKADCVERDDNAVKICRAMNAYDPMVSALRSVRDHLGQMSPSLCADFEREIDAALAIATEEFKA